ncbi:unnamed protein product [Sphagnum jensenii]|uniref:BURP domain-containing protein n=1 Tax=Sphagnum jensenii TaxID=128206 RepID=A0ABP1BHC1_9BRYO
MAASNSLTFVTLLPLVLVMVLYIGAINMVMGLPRTAVEDEVSGMSSSFWQQLLPSTVSIPPILRSSVSPVEDTLTADRFAAAISRGAIFPATAAAFCKAAGLICEQDIDIGPYTSSSSQQQHLHGPHPAAGAAPRAIGIKTINDFQFDFFLEDQLVKGGQMKLVENLHDPIPKRAFLPFVVAESLPALTTPNLPQLLHTFNINEGSKMATIMGTAVYLCESPALMGEERACPTSVEAMADFVSSEIGTNVEVLATTGAPSAAPNSSNSHPVRILEFSKRSLREGEHIVICHNLMFPSQLYYCHHVTGTKVVQASLLQHQEEEGNTGSPSSIIHAVAICHLDTSMWASEHPAFAALNIPRGAEACHWSGQNDLVWMATR